MPALRRFPRCLYCRENLAAHQKDLHPGCEAPYAAEQAAAKVMQEAEELEAYAGLHSWLDSLAEKVELESWHALDADRCLAGAA